MINNDGASAPFLDCGQWSALGLGEELVATVSARGFLHPTPIQRLAIPRLLGGAANTLARARTGTGKTAAFCLPIIEILSKKTDAKTRALILEPTRELAQQTQSELEAFAGGAVTSCVLFGGGSYPLQLRALKTHPKVVVGTPGRVQDHLARGSLDLGELDFFILDEADEMLDMGFIGDIRAIFSQANSAARILMFSATMSAPIKEIASNFMGDYEVIEEEKTEDVPLLIDQKFWVVRREDKCAALMRLIDSAKDFYALVFTQTKVDASEVAKALLAAGYGSAALHGDVSQSERERVLSLFRDKNIKILVATDVAARGIDVTALTHVVNYSLPRDVTTYIHRIGRTGRAGSEGAAVTFVTPGDLRKITFFQRDLKRLNKGTIERGEVPSIEEVLKAKRAKIENAILSSLNLSDNYTKEKSKKKKTPFTVMAKHLLRSIEEGVKKSSIDEDKVGADVENGAVDNKGAGSVSDSVGNNGEVGVNDTADEGVAKSSVSVVGEASASGNVGNSGAVGDGGAVGISDTAGVNGSAGIGSENDAVGNSGVVSDKGAVGVSGENGVVSDKGAVSDGEAKIGEVFFEKKRVEKILATALEALYKADFDSQKYGNIAQSHSGKAPAPKGDYKSKKAQGSWGKKAYKWQTGDRAFSKKKRNFDGDFGDAHDKKKRDYGEGFETGRKRSEKDFDKSFGKGRKSGDGGIGGKKELNGEQSFGAAHKKGDFTGAGFSKKRKYFGDMGDGAKKRKKAGNFDKGAFEKGEGKESFAHQKKGKAQGDRPKKSGKAISIGQRESYNKGGEEF